MKRRFFIKLISSLLVFVVVLNSFLFISAKTTKAANVWYNQGFKEWFVKVYDDDTSSPTEIFGERYTAAQVQWVLFSIQAQVINFMVGDNMDIAVCAMTNDMAQCADAIKDFFLNLENPLSSENSSSKSALALITSNPISGIGYTKRLITKLNLIPEVKAQGFGYEAINPIQILWKMSRDLSYGFLVIAIIILAFMIMFRIKINPQTVITVQSALPKVIFATILITFSYAIAGFMVDLMYVALSLVVTMFTSEPYKLFGYSWSEMLSFLLGRNIFDIFAGYWMGFTLTALATIFTPNFIQGILLVIFALILIFYLIWISIKSIFLLLKNLALILLTIAIGPLEILIGTVSNTGMGFGSWLKRLVSYLAVYPIITVIILLAHLFLAQGMPKTLISIIHPEESPYVTGLPFNPLYGEGVIGDNQWNIPFTVGDIVGMKVVWIIVSLVLISLIPKVFDMIKSFMEKRPFQYQSDILGTARGIGQWADATTESDLMQRITRSRSQSTRKIGEGLRAIADKLRLLGTLPK